MKSAAFARIASSTRAKQTRKSREKTERMARRRLLLEQLEGRAMMATFNVTASVADGAAGSLRAAITSANSNNEHDTINLAAGTYVLTQWLSLTENGKTITFQGDTAANTIVDANHTGRVFGAGYGVTAIFNDMTIRNGGSTSSRPTGAGIDGYYATITVNDSVIEDNLGYQGGGIYVNPGTVTVNNSVIRNNDTTRDGGGIFAYGGAVTISNSTISGNTAGSGYQGGGIYLWNASASLSSVTIDENTGGYGGGLSLYSSSLSITGGSITDNDSPNYGGGLAINAPNSAISISGAAISGNEAPIGGGIYHTGGSATLTLTETTVANNKALSTNPNYGEGGGIFTYKPLELIRSTISGNQATRNGGGTLSNSTLTVTNSTVSGNSAATGAGMNINTPASGSAILNSTIASNASSGSGGGLSMSNYASISMKNTILANNTAGSGSPPDFNGYNATIASQGYNLFSASGMSAYITGTTTGNQLGVNPQLGSLADNGGPTLTHSLASNSPAIDAGTSSGAPAVDQRNQSRPIDGDSSGTAQYDIGAFEYVVTNPPPTADNDAYTAVEDTTLNVNAASGVLNGDTPTSGLSAILITGSGKDPTKGAISLSSDGSFTYTPSANENGTDYFYYKASNGTKESGEAKVTITITAVNDTPTANSDSYKLNEDATLNLISYSQGVLANDTDVESSTLTMSVVSYPDKVTGTLTPYSNGTFLFVTATDYHGETSFTYKAYDGSAYSAEQKVTIVVESVDDEPMGFADSGYSINEDGGTLEINATNGVLANDYDGDDDTLTASLAIDPETEKAKTVTHGTLDFNSDGSFDYTPDSNFEGADYFYYIASDGTYSSAETKVTITVSPVNDAPTAVDDTNSTNEDSPIYVSAKGVLANDEEIDIDDSLTVIDYQAASTQGAAVVVYSDGSYSYDPTTASKLQALRAEDSIEDTFTYTISDSKGSTKTATVTITVEGIEGGTATVEDYYYLDEEGSALVSAPGVLGNDVEEEGDAVTVAVDSWPTGSLTLYSDGSFDYYPPTDFAGQDSFTYIATSGSVSSSATTVYLYVSNVNDYPTLASSVGPVYVNENSSPSELSLMGAFTDADLPYGDWLTYSIAGNDNSSLITAEIVSDNLVLTYATNAYGYGQITVRATDSQGAYAEMVVEVTVTIVNNAPTVTDTLFDLLVVKDAPNSFLSLVGVFDDVDFGTHGDTLTYSVTSGDTDLAVASVVSGQILLDYVAGEVGVTEITVRATDTEGSYVETAFQLTVGDSSLQESGFGGFSAPEFIIDFGECGEFCPSGMTYENPDFTFLFDQGETECPTCPPLEADADPARPDPNHSNSDRPQPMTVGNNNPHPIFSFDYHLPLGSTVPETVEAQVSLGGVSSTPVFYDFSNVDAGDSVRISLQLDATVVPTGDYVFTVDLVQHFVGVDVPVSVSGHYQIFNWAESVFGNRRWLPELDRLEVSEDGAAWMKGNSRAIWFPADGVGGFEAPTGSFSRLETTASGWVVVMPHGDEVEFDSTGLMRIRRDANGNEKYYAYYDVLDDGFATEPAFITDAFGRTTTFHYTDGLVDSITDFAGRKTSYDYDGYRLETIAEPDPDGSGPLPAPVTTFTHNSIGLVTSETDPLLNVTTYTYDDFTRRMTGGTNPDGGAWSMTGQVVRGLIDPSSGEGTELNPADVVFSEDATGVYTDARGNSRTSSFDQYRNPLRSEDELGNIRTWVRDEHGRATEWTLPDPDDFTSRGGTDGPLPELVYAGTCDVCGNRDYILYPDGSEEHWTYEHTFNRMTSHIDQLDRVTLYDIDPANGNLLGIQRVVGLEDGVGNSETNDILYSFTYTDGTGALPAGLLLTETDPLGRVTEYEYEDNPEALAFGWLIAVTMAAGTADEATTGYEYDVAGNVIAIVDPLGRRTEMAYDSLDRLISITGEDPDGAGSLTSPVTSFTYDALGRLLTTTDPLGHVTTYLFGFEEIEPDEFRETQTITLPDPDGSGPLSAPTSIIELDLAGNLAKQTDPLLRVTSYLYDELNRPETVTLPDPDGAGSLDAPVVSTIYDNIGNIHSTEDALGNITTYEYDVMSRLIKLTLPDPDGAGPLTAPVYDYEYFADGQLKLSKDPLGRETHYAYDDDLGWLTSVTQPDPDDGGPLSAPVTTYEYDAVGNLTKVTEPGGAVTEYEYDALNRQTKITAPDPDGGGSLTSPVTDYEFDLAGQLVSVTDPLGRVTEFEYDGLGRQISITLPDPDGAGSLASPVISKTYDAANRLLTTTDPLGNVTTYAYDNLSRLISVTQPDPDGIGSLTSPVTTYAYDAASQLLSITDPLGRTTTYAYDALGRQTSITQPDPDGAGSLTSPVTSFVYDAHGNLLAITDPLGNVTTNAYDDLHRRIGVTLPDPDGGGSLTSSVYAYAFNAASELVSVTDPLSRVTAYTYDALSRLKTLTLPDPDDGGSLTSPVYSYTYDDALDLVAETDPLSNVTAYTYDKLHRRVGVTQADPDGGGSLTSPVWSFVFNAANELVSQTDPLSRVTSYAYDGLGRMKALTQPDPDGTGSLTSPVTAYSYDAASNLKTVTDPLSRVTSYDYDNLHRQTKITLPDPDGAGSQTSPIWNYSYDAASQLVSQSDPLGRVTSYTYDKLGRLKTLTQPDPDDGGSLTAPVRSFDYDAASNVQLMTDARGYVTDYDYDNLYRRTKVTRPDPDGGGSLTSPVWEYSYDAASQLLDQTDPMERTTGYAYDKLGRLLTVTQPDPDTGGSLTSPVTSYAYDKVGNLVTVTDPLTHVKTYGYDNLYRRTSVTDPLSGVTSFTFDSAGQLKTLTDPVSNTTSWFYDDLGRVIEEKNQLDKSRYFAYDSVGNLTERTDRNGRIIEYVYDNLNRNTDENWFNGSTQVRNINFEFDAANQLISVEDPSATNNFTYDKLGRVTNEVQTIAGFSDTLELMQEFDALGNRTQAEFEYGTEATLRTDYVYDGLSRMTQQTQYDSTSSDIAWKRVTFQYNAASQFSEIERFVGNSTTPISVATTTYDYDGIGRLKELLHFTDTTTWAGYEYDYDAASRITAIDSFVDGLTEYDYDNTNQLTDADHASLTDEAYSYDANGNRTMSGYVIDDNNQLASDGTYTYGYDDEGNRTSRTNISTGFVTTYIWDHRNRLVAATELDDEETVLSTVEFTYDAFDRWITRSYDADGPGGASATDTIFAHDGNQIALEFEDSTGNVDGEDLTHTYSWGPAIDQLLADEAFAEEPLWALSDFIGTPRDLVAYDNVAEETELRNHRVYDSSGKLDSQSSSTYTTAIGFTGRPFELSTNLQNNRHRWYDAHTQQWLSEDPIQFAAGDANLRRYVGNEPISLTDPSGLATDSKGNQLDPSGRVANPQYDRWGRPVNSSDVTTGSIVHHFLYLDQWGRPVYDIPLWAETPEDVERYREQQARVNAPRWGEPGPYDWAARRIQPAGWGDSVNGYMAMPDGTVIPITNDEGTLAYRLRVASQPLDWALQFGALALIPGPADEAAVLSAARRAARPCPPRIIPVRTAPARPIPPSTAVRPTPPAIRPPAPPVQGPPVNPPLQGNPITPPAIRPPATPPVQGPPVNPPLQGNPINIVGGGQSNPAPAVPVTSGNTLVTYYPPNDGFSLVRDPQIVTLTPGQTFTRYGGYFDDAGQFRDFGNYVAPPEVPYEMRALQPCADARPYTTYVVTRPIENVRQGPAAPWFGQIGGGVQQQLPLPIQDLIDQGYLRPIDRVVPR